MKQLFIISISLSVLTGGLIINNYYAGSPNNAGNYWWKETNKGLLRDNNQNTSLRQAIRNSLHFIASGLPVKILAF